MSRLRKPAKIKIAEGNRAKQGLAKIGVDLITNGKPTPPDHLTDIEARLWREITWSLPDDLLSQADIGILERHVIAWARFRDCQEKIRKFLTAKIYLTVPGKKRRQWDGVSCP